MELVGAIRDVGFPAAAFVMLFLLMRTTLSENTRALLELGQMIRELKGYLLRTDGAGCARGACPPARLTEGE